MASNPTALLASFGHLPVYPASRHDYDAWMAWGAAYAALEQVPVSRGEESPTQRNRLSMAWRALIGHWAGRSVAPDDAPLTMHHLLLHAHRAPPFVLLAATQLAYATLDAGVTSTDALFLLATFVWPLRETQPELSRLAWLYMVHAPWQSDPLTQRDLILAVHHHEAWRNGRGLIDLADARRDAGLRASERSFLEAVALIQTRKVQMEQIHSYRDFLSVELVDGAHLAIVRLAKLYIEIHEDQVYAREILKRAAELTRSPALVHHIERRAWDRSLDEIYTWTQQLKHPRHLDHEIRFALKHGQPHHARRIAEAVIIRKYKRLWYGSAVDNLHGALERFEHELQGNLPPSDPISRRAAEHLATLYVRTHHVTQHARSFVHAIARSIPFTGKGAELHDMRDELEFFFNRSDPYHVLRHEDSLITSRQDALSDDEKAASDEVQRWFSMRFRHDKRRTLDRLARYISAPIVDVARHVSGLPLVEDVCSASFRAMLEQGHRLTGDLAGISHRAAEIRSQYGHGMKLIDYARDVTRPEIIAASLAAGASSFLPPGSSVLAHVTDLSSSLLLAFRAVARVGAVFGRDLHAPQGWRLIADSFSIGLSSKDGEGMVTYLSRGSEQLTTSITIGGVAYGSARLVEYLWIAPRAHGERPSEQLVRHLARVCGFELSHQAVVTIVPMVGALLSGLSTYAFMHIITEAAIHVAARDALLVRAQSYEQS